MKNRPTIRLEYINPVNLTRYEVDYADDWRYQKLFQWLQISPSYRLAHDIATKKLDRSTVTLPRDFDQVDTAFGDVYEIFFAEWWYKRAQFCFKNSTELKISELARLHQDQTLDATFVEELRGALDNYENTDRMQQGNPETLFLAVPITSSRKEMLKLLSDYIATNIRQFPPPITTNNAQWKLIKDKTRERTLDIDMRVFINRCQNPDVPLYYIGNISGVAPHHETDSEIKDRNIVGPARRNMEILTSRHLNRAYCRAENAARGKFPSLDPLPEDPNRPSFDYEEQEKHLQKHENWKRARNFVGRFVKSKNFGDRVKQMNSKPKSTSDK